MKATSKSKRYTVIEANTNDDYKITGYKAKPDPTFWEEVDYSLKQDFKRAAWIVGPVLYILFVLWLMGR